MQVSEPLFEQIVKLTLTGMSALAHHGYTWTDAKPENTLLSAVGGYLTDFGNCVTNFNQAVTGPILCSDGYIPPEIAAPVLRGSTGGDAWIDHCRTGQPARSMVYSWGVTLCVPRSIVPC